MSAGGKVRPAAEVADAVWRSFRDGNGNVTAGKHIEARDSEVRAAALEEAAAAVCRYVGKCNSSRCPCHVVRALAAQAKASAQAPAQAKGGGRG